MRVPRFLVDMGLNSCIKREPKKWLENDGALLILSRIVMFLRILFAIHVHE